MSRLPPSSLSLPCRYWNTTIRFHLSGPPLDPLHSVSVALQLKKHRQTQFSSCDPRSVKRRGIITFLHLPATALLLQHQILMALAAASPRVAPVQIAVPQGLFCRAAAQAGSAQPGWLLRIMPFQYMTSHLSSLSLMQVPRSNSVPFFLHIQLNSLVSEVAELNSLLPGPEK